MTAALNTDANWAHVCNIALCMALVNYTLPISLSCSGLKDVKAE